MPLGALQILKPKQLTLLLVHWPFFPRLPHLLETVSHVHGSDAHSRVDLKTSLPDLEAIHMQWEDLLTYAENARANWTAFTAVYVPLNKHAVLDSSSLHASRLR